MRTSPRKGKLCPRAELGRKKRETVGCMLLSVPARGVRSTLGLVDGSGPQQPDPSTARDGCGGERKWRENGWCEGGSPLHEAVRLANRLHRANPVTGQRRSLRKISAELVAAGHIMVRKYRGS